MTQFLRTEHRGDNLVAVFDRGYPLTWDDGYGRRQSDDGTFCLNEESLKLRIANLERDGHDASAERFAFDVMATAGSPDA